MKNQAYIMNLEGWDDYIGIDNRDILPITIGARPNPYLMGLEGWDQVRNTAAENRSLSPYIMGLEGWDEVKNTAGDIESVINKIKPLANISKKINDAAAKLGIGGATQDRFIDRTMQVYSIFDNAGYKTSDTKPTDGGMYKNFGIGKSQVADRKSSGNYAPEFERLRKYIIARLNHFNPGSGDLYEQYFPEFKMANQGQMISEPITALAELVKVPAGQYKQSANQSAILPAASYTAETAGISTPSLLAIGAALVAGFFLLEGNK